MTTYKYLLFILYLFDGKCILRCLNELNQLDISILESLSSIILDSSMHQMNKENSLLEL